MFPDHDNPSTAAAALRTDYRMAPAHDGRPSCASPFRTGRSGAAAAAVDGLSWSGNMVDGLREMASLCRIMFLAIAH